MKNNKEAMEEVREIVSKIRYLDSMDSLLYCDRWSVCPEEGFEYENLMSGFLTEMRNSLLVNKKVAGLVKQFSGCAPSDFKDDLQRGQVNYLAWRYEDEVQVSAKLRGRLNTACTQGQQAWEKSWKENDMKAFMPYMKTQFELMGEIAHAINPNEPPYQVLINRFDRGVRAEDLNHMFKSLKDEILSIMKESEKAWDTVDFSMLGVSPDKETSRHLVAALQDLLKFDKSRGVMYEAHHPVCSLVGPRDSRPSTNYTALFQALVGAAHESGHGMYNYNSPETLIKAGLWGGIEGTMHESQSKFYENMVYLSEEFWTAFLPVVKKSVPEMQGISPREVTYALAKPKRQPVRLKADELTVSLHIIIRYELERDYYEGRIKVEDLEEAWNEKYQEYLGIRPETSREGILQDVHWATGYIGYFQGYVLGSMYAAQFRHKLLEDVPDAWAYLASGDIMPINNWLKNNVHQYGQIYTAEETLKKATGESLNSQYFIEYLREKYLIKAPKALNL